MWVCDTGRGIPADKLDSIFDPFVHVNRQKSAGEEINQGMGLGLAISRELARAMAEISSCRPRKLFVFMSRNAQSAAQFFGPAAEPGRGAGGADRVLARGSNEGDFGDPSNRARRAILCHPIPRGTARTGCGIRAVSIPAVRAGRNPISVGRASGIRRGDLQHERGSLTRIIRFCVGRPSFGRGSTGAARGSLC